MNNQSQEYYTPYQLKFPIEIEKIIETTDPVYTFCEVMNHIDLSKYLTTEDRRTGRPRYEEETLLKVILFAFMENGYESLRKIEKLCKTDIRFMWLLQDNPPPSHSTMSIMTYRLSCFLHISIWTKQLKDFMANSFSIMTTDGSKDLIKLFNKQRTGSP